MAETLVRARDVSFVLYELLEVERLTARERYRDHARETFDAALATARQIAERHFAPHNRKADLEEPRLVEGRVETVPEVKAALDAFAAAGFLAAHHDSDRGGMQLPWVVTQACFAHFQAANIATVAYPFLTMAAANLIEAHGSEAQKALYLPPMLDGRFFGTMALSEPQAGSSLADIRTRATPTPEGHYLLSGHKMWISGGAHELSENIIHLVLARIAGAPAGVRGISLFIVPRYHVEPGGGRGPANDVALAGLIHKMGYRGTTSTVLNFGEQGRCVGHLVGEPNRGLAYMFHMMNEARIGVGLGAAMLGYAGYLSSLDYARNRPQGRRPGAKDPDAPPVMVVEHADVRRMLLAQKVYVEGAFALCLYAAWLVDEQRTSPEDRARGEAKLLLDLITPICKAWSSDYALKANDHAIQILGGYGYTRDYPVEQHYRDNRLNPIHEGTNGIQAIDLLGRKVASEGGDAFALLMREIEATVAAAGEIPGLGDFAGALDEAARLAAATTARMLAARPEGEERFLANATLYLDMLGHVVMGWIWLRQAMVAARRLPQKTDADFYRGKIQACRYFFLWELPKIRHQAEILARLDPTCLDMRDAWF